MTAPWQWFLLGYLATIALETPVLLLGLSRQHPWPRKLGCGLWLTSCTYPIVFLVLPAWFDVHDQRNLYLLIAEAFAPLAECALFWWAFHPLQTPLRDFGTITLANLVSFGVGEAWHRFMA